MGSTRLEDLRVATLGQPRYKAVKWLHAEALRRGFQVAIFNSGFHMRVEGASGTFDVWPDKRGFFQWRLTTQIGEGGVRCGWQDRLLFDVYGDPLPEPKPKVVKPAPPAPPRPEVEKITYERTSTIKLAERLLPSTHTARDLISTTGYDYGRRRDTETEHNYMLQRGVDLLQRLAPMLARITDERQNLLIVAVPTLVFEYQEADDPVGGLRVFIRGPQPSFCRKTLAKLQAKFCRGLVFGGHGRSAINEAVSDLRSGARTAAIFQCGEKL